MKEDFDDILRKKWEEKQFPVDQAHRADMIRLLDENNRRRTGVLWWFFGGGIACTLIALFVILADAGKLDKVISPTENVPAIEAGEAKAQAEAKEMNEAQDGNESQAKNEAMLRPANPQPGAMVRPALPTTSSYSSPTAAQQPAQAEAKESDNSKNKDHASDTELEEVKMEKSVLDAEAINNTDLRNAEKENANFNQKSKAEEIKKVDIKTNVNKSNTNSKVGDKKKEKTIASTDVIDKPGDDKNELNTNLSNPSDNIVIGNSEESSETVVPVVTPNAVESTTDPVGTTNEITPLVVRNNFITDPIDALAFGNIDYTSNHEPGNIEPVIVKRHPVWLFAEAGAGFVPAPKSNIKSGYTLRAGGGVGYGLSTKNSLTLSGGYMMQKNGFDFQRSSTVLQSGFAARSNFNTLTPDQLHFVYARLGIHHRIKRHMISVFGGGQYLYGAKGAIVVKSEDTLSGISEDTIYGWVKLDGMNQLWWNAELNYGYQITPRLSIQAGVKYNFTSIVAKDPDLEDDFFWKGNLSSLSPSFTINYHLYGKR